MLPKGEVAAQYRLDRFEREQRRANQLQATVSEDVTMEQLLESIGSQPIVEEMFRAAVEAAVSATSELKIRLLGKAVSNGVLAIDEAAVDEAQQLLRLASELDAVDIRVLVKWRESAPQMVTNPYAFIRDECGVSGVVAGPILARLEQLGLVEREQTAQISSRGERVQEDDEILLDDDWRLSAAAHALLDLLAART